MADADELRYVDVDDFAAGAEVLSELIADGEAAVGVGPSGATHLLLWDWQAVETALEKRDMPPDVFDAVQADLEDALLAFSAGANEATFVRVRSSSDREASHGFESEESARKKFVLVQQLFDTEAIAYRAWVKETSKLPTLRDVGWESLTKHHDDDARRIGYPRKTAVLQLGGAIWTGSDFDESGYIVCVDEVDVEILIRTLQRLRLELHQTPEPGVD